jgi:predicted PurR-regulated permease PerM
MLFSLSNIMAWLFSISNFAFNVFFYFTVVIYFLNDGNDLVQQLFKVIPIQPDAKKTVHNSLNDSLRGVFSGSMKLAIYSALYTWMIFDWAQISYVYLYSLVAAFFKIVPLVSSSMIGLIAAC